MIIGTDVERSPGDHHVARLRTTTIIILFIKSVRLWSAIAVAVTDGTRGDHGWSPSLRSDERVQGTVRGTPDFEIYFKFWIEISGC